MIRIEIESTKLNQRSGVSKETQKPYSMQEQMALMFRQGERYPEKIKLTLDKDALAYPVGHYMLSDESFELSRFAGIQIRPRLIPMSSAVAEIDAFLVTLNLKPKATA